VTINFLFNYIQDKYLDSLDSLISQKMIKELCQSNYYHLNINLKN